MVRAACVGAILALLANVGLAQEAPEDQPLPALPTTPVTLVVDGRASEVAAALTEIGPLFAINPVVQALGGELIPDALAQSYSLVLEGTSSVFGASSSAMTVGEDIVLLSQPARASDVDVLVPLDLLQRTYGDLLGYELTWDTATATLSSGRSASRQLPVGIDVVHVSGITTVVLSFPQPPRLRVVEDPGRIDVVLTGDRVQTTTPTAVDDPLVQGIEIVPERITLRLAPGAEADHYTLRRPYRLVFEIFRTTTTTSEPVQLRPLAPVAGIQTIVLDPGHGGSETGAIGPAGTAEKHLTLIIAQALKANLERRLGVRVVLTRSEDADLPLDTRAALANQHKADLFMSIHLNSSLGAGARGAETYFLAPQASDAAAASSAAVENAADALASASAARDQSGDGDPLYDLQLMLWDLAQTHHLGASQRLAGLIQGELNQALELRDRGVKQAPFRVLMGAAMPAVLVELGFISNPEEEGKLNTPSYRAELVDALVRAVSRYRGEVVGQPATPEPPVTNPAPGPGPS